MKSHISNPKVEKGLKLSWGKSFFVCAGFIGLYDIVYLIMLGHVIFK